MNSKFIIYNLKFSMRPELPFAKAGASEPFISPIISLLPESRDEVFNSFFPYRGVRGSHSVKSLRKEVVNKVVQQDKMIILLCCWLTGNRNTNSNYNNRGTNTNLWSSTVGTTGAWKRNLNSTESNVNRNTNNKTNGFSVRCLKDWLEMVEMLPNRSISTSKK